MAKKILSFGIWGLNVFKIDVEVDVLGGLPSFNIVGLPDASIKESKERVRAALKNCRFDFPKTRVIVNLAPANLKKEGALLDLPVAMGILSQTRQLISDLSHYAFAGELSLNGNIKKINGALCVALKSKELKIKNLIVPYDNYGECSSVKGVNILPFKHLNEIITYFNDGLKPTKPRVKKITAKALNKYDVDFSEVKNQRFAKRAIEIATAGGHNLIMVGPPGCGKTMLAKRIPAILPDLTLNEAYEVTKIHSIAGLLDTKTQLVKIRPFRSPHHTISSAGLAGGGARPQPGEISYAHNGVLFLDELFEFKRNLLDLLRQPLETKQITLSRAAGTVIYPCRFMLVAASNPCPCGYFNHPKKQCKCTPYQIHKYINRLSGPLMDRIDIQIEMRPVKIKVSGTPPEEEPSLKIKKRIRSAVEFQESRFKKLGIKNRRNADLNVKELKKVVCFSSATEELLNRIITVKNISARSVHSLIKLSRTIADLALSENVKEEHIIEASNLRNLDRFF